LSALKSRADARRIESAVERDMSMAITSLHRDLAL